MEFLWTLLYYLLLGLLLIIVVVTYFLPIVVAKMRRSRLYASVCLINLTLGWTLLGWAIAMTMALRQPGDLDESALSSGEDSCRQ